MYSYTTDNMEHVLQNIPNPFERKLAVISNISYPVIMFSHIRLKALIVCCMFSP